MTDQLQSLATRLCGAKSPYDLQDWEGRDGYYLTACRVSRDDVPQLLQIAAKWVDLDWPDNDPTLDVDGDEVELLPVTAWRTLADLKADEAVEPLIELLDHIDDEDDDWVSTELPHVFGKIGMRAIDPLDRFAWDPAKPTFVRVIAAEALPRIAEYHPESRDRVVACLAKMMANAAGDDIHFNSTVLNGLVDLRAAEAAEPIERAFAGNHLDVGMLGDWEYVRRTFGVEGLGLEMPEHPHDSVGQFRIRMGIGIFCDKQIFDFAGELTDAEQDYYEQAWKLFSKSKEAEQVVERCGGLLWAQSLLEFGVNYLGEIVDAMTLASVREYVLDFVPRKVSTEPGQAAAIVLELTKFWEYLDRVYALPEAKPITEWLLSDGLVSQLEAELSDPANFGMAKSMYMAGTAAGYDMTSEAGMNQFMIAYNQSKTPSKTPSNQSDNVSPLGTIVSDRPRVGRNDPCPCGSGKKFKKCCR